MPTIDELMRKSKKKFKKSVYRPWNYMDEMEKETQLSNIGINNESRKNTINTVKERSDYSDEKPTKAVIKGGREVKINEDGKAIENNTNQKSDKRQTTG